MLRGFFCFCVLLPGSRFLLLSRVPTRIVDCTRVYAPLRSLSHHGPRFRRPQCSSADVVVSVLGIAPVLRGRARAGRLPRDPLLSPSGCDWVEMGEPHSWNARQQRAAELRARSNFGLPSALGTCRLSVRSSRCGLVASDGEFQPGELCNLLLPITAHCFATLSSVYFLYVGFSSLKGKQIYCIT